MDFVCLVLGGMEDRLIGFSKRNFFFSVERKRVSGEWKGLLGGENEEYKVRIFVMWRLGRFFWGFERRRGGYLMDSLAGMHCREGRVNK